LARVINPALEGDPMAVTASKVCTVCNADCADRPRVKDEFGRYTCKACFDKQARGAAAAPAPKSAPRVVTPPPVARGYDDDGLDLRSAALIEAKMQPVDLPEAQSCPKCHGFMSGEQRLCMRCGYDRKRGSKVATRVEAVKERDSSADQKRQWIRNANNMAWGMLLTCVGLTGAAFISHEMALVSVIILSTMLSLVGTTTKICQAIDREWGWFAAGFFLFGITDLIWILMNWRIWLKIMAIGSLVGSVASLIALLTNAS